MNSLTIIVSYFMQHHSSKTRLFCSLFLETFSDSLIGTVETERLRMPCRGCMHIDQGEPLFTRERTDRVTDHIDGAANLLCRALPA